MKPPAPVPLFLVNADEPYAYACGHCGFVRVSYSCHRKWDGKDTNSTRAEAERCCACFACGEFNPRDASTSIYCAACTEKQRAEDEARRAASATKAIEDAASFEDAVAHHSEAFVFTIGNRTGRAFLCDDYGGGFEQGFVRLDATADDPNPRVYHAGLKRGPTSAVMEPLMELCDYLAALPTAWREVTVNRLADTETP